MDLYWPFIAELLKRSRLASGCGVQAGKLDGVV
jgi:hypothetical protein